MTCYDICLCCEPCINTTSYENDPENCPCLKDKREYVKLKHAHWILVDNDITTFVYQCSNCKDTIAVPFGMINEFNGCPYCLSKMDEVVE